MTVKRLSYTEKLKVRTNIEGTPVDIVNKMRPERIVRIYDKWRSQDGNADKKGRCYFKIRTNKGFIYDIYREEMSNDWYIGKIYE